MNKIKLLKDIAELRREVFRRDPVTKEYGEVQVPPTVFEREGKVFVSGEDGFYYVDYYGESANGYAFIDPRLEAIARKHGGFWEWENPACVYFVEG